jgi:very-short-patch-repair endonuclease
VLAQLAAPQHGVVTRTQLLTAGFNVNAIEYRLRIGRLHRLHHGVYAVGHRPPSPHARAMAAVLACGTGAALSHRSAAALWAITPPWRGPVDVTARSHHQHRGIRAHRSGTLTRPDITRHYGIPITTPARTLQDLARVLPSHSLTRAVNEARIRNLVSDADEDEATGPTRSHLEDEFLRFIERYDLPRPEVNQTVAGYEVDMLWRDRKLIVELDSRTFHRHTFEEDRERDAHLLSEGFAVVRITKRRLRNDPKREASRLRRMLSGEGGIRTLGRG